MKNYVPLVDDKISKTVSQVVPQHNRGKHDPYKVPPDFAEAEGHRLATRIARPLNKAPNVPIIKDHATGYPVENQQMGLCCDLDEMNFLSPGYPMYFQWIRFCICIGLIVVVFSGIYNLQSFVNGTACIDEHDMASIAQERSESHNDTQSGPAQGRQPQTSPSPTRTDQPDQPDQEEQPDETQENPSDQPTTTVTTTTTSNPDGSDQTMTTTTSIGFDFERMLEDSASTEADGEYEISASDKEEIGQLLEVCPRNWINRFSLANKDREDFDLEKTDIYNFFTIIILLLVMQFVRKIQKQTAILVDERQITASDFTAKVSNIPLNFTEKEDIDEEIRKFFIDHGLPGRKLNVQQVSVCYNCGPLLKEDKKIKQNIEKRAQLLAKKQKHELVSDDDIRRCETEIEASKREIINISNRFKEGVGVSKQFEGEAYVSFDTQQELQLVLKHWRLGTFATLKERLTSNSQYKFRGNVLKVRQAPEPSDVYWENAGTSQVTKFTLKVFTNIVTLILLAAGFYTIFIINSAKVNVLAQFSLKKESAEEKTFAITFKVKVISIVASVVVVLVNQILRIVIHFLTEREKFSTHTEFQSSYAQRLALCQFLNTAFVTFAIAVYFNNIAGPGGLTYTAFFIFVTNVGVQWGMVLFSPATLMYYWKRSRVNKNKEHCYLTQEQLNTVYRFPEFDFATKYAGYAKTIMSACFFAPLVPLVVVVATVGIIFEYAFDKYVLLRHRSRGRSIGPELSFEFVEFLEYCLVLFSIGNFLANIKVSHFDVSEENLTVIGLGIGLLNAILPMDRVNDWLFPAKDESLTDDRYSQVKHTFLEDYGTSNPATEVAAAEMCRFAESQVQQMA